MTYLAPRQGLFAIIILVSFCLQTLLLVISTDQQLTKSREQKGEQMVAQLIDEARLSLENKDRVSLSVIANRYTSEQDVARIVIKDSNDEILVPVGNAPMQQGDTISQMATKGDAVIGSVALTLKDISKGEIIAMQWPFVIGSLIFHLFLWLLYGYVARPTKEQINALSRDIQDLHREQYVQSGQLSYGRAPNENYTEERDSATGSNDTLNSTVNNNVNNDTATPSDETGKTNKVSAAGIHDELNAYLKSQQTNSSDSQTSSNTSTDMTQSSRSTSTVNSSTDAQASTGIDSSSAHKFISSASKLSANRAFDTVSVQIMFHDEYDMLERLAPEMRMPYLALCTQLLNQAMTELLKQPLLLGVSVVNEPRFDEVGACAVLKADNSHAKAALAGVMLGKLYLMLNKIIHEKHIELSRFALPAKAGVSDEAQTQAMTQLLKSVGRKEQMLILLPNSGLKQIGSHVQVKSLKRPTTVYERECAVFDGVNDAMIQRLATVRNAVLMTGTEDEEQEIAD
ncbi:hypothetical protein [Psychrobacter sp. P11G5]|uniref:hypothetical protein n=1 Tax=Psychrobacter sp. P11G5 TaxID=1699624 RepID=UPI00078B849E|nr:hypothetical protein [Psychrobacter sp. P11G5]AMN68367.1 hypothetical protein AK825_12260 [Psychrobacter sp. P11G5]